MTHRIHYHPRTERRIVIGALCFFLACVALIALTSCSPYAVSPENFTELTATPSPSTTATITATATATPAPLSCVVNAASVYLRNGAGMMHAAIDVLHRGDRLTVLRGGDWLNVQTLDGIKGFIYGRFCR